MFSIIWYGLNGQHVRFALLSNNASSNVASWSIVFTFCCGVCHFCQKVKECRSHHSGVNVNTFERRNIRCTRTSVTHTRPTQPLKTVWVMMSHILVHLFACLHSHRVSLSTCDLIDQKAFFQINCKQAQWKLCCFGTSTRAKITQAKANKPWIWGIFLCCAWSSGLVMLEHSALSLWVFICWN